MSAKYLHLYERDPRQAKPKVSRKDRRLDGALLAIIIVLLTVGMIALYTASYPIGYFRYGDAMLFVGKQLRFALAGIVMMLAISYFDYHIYGRWEKVLFVLSIVMLLLIFTPLGIEHNKARRWLGYGSFEFQPSEVVKLAVIISFSYHAAKAGEKIRTFRQGILPYFAALFVIALLLYKQPHMSATIIIFGTGLAILFVAGIKLWYFVPLGVIGAAGAVVAYQTLEHVRTRIAVWLDPFIDYQNAGFQGANSHIAIGSGGFWGLGLGQGRQKHLYLPEPQNDFVFSAWCEETGFIGAVLVMLLFAYLIYRGFYIARSSRDKFGCLLAVGITTKLAIQTLINLFVVTGLFPVTGASLPFFSYGGTALLIELCEMGILLNISRNMRRDE